MNSKQQLERIETFFKEQMVRLCGESVNIYYKPTAGKTCPVNLFEIKENSLWMEFRSSKGNLFLLGINKMLFYMLYDHQLGYNSTLETASDFTAEEPTELEMKTSLVYLKNFADVSAFFSEQDSSTYQISDITDQRTLERNIPSLSFKLMEFECSGEKKRYGFLYLAVQESLWGKEESCTEEQQIISSQKEHEIRIRIGEARVLLDDLRHLQAGDTLQTTIPADSLFWVEVDGHSMFRGRPGFFEGKMSILLEK